MGIFLGAACGLFAGLLLARPYLSTLSSQLHLFGLCAAGFGVVTALVAPLGFPPVRRWARRVFVGRSRLPVVKWRLPSLAASSQWVLFALPLLVLIGFAVRPYVQVTRGFTDPSVIRYVSALQRLTGLPVDGRRQYYELSFDWMLWYLGVPAVLLGCAGACLLGRRLVRATTGQAFVPAARLWSLVYLVVAWTVVTVLWDPAALPGQPDASRRLVPVVLPGVILLALWASCLLQRRAYDFGARQLTSRAVGGCCALALVIPAFWSSFAPSVSVSHKAVSGVTTSLAWRGVAVSKTGLGTAGAVSSLCSAIGSNTSVVFTDALSADYFASVVRGECRQPVAVVAGAPGDYGPGAGGIGVVSGPGTSGIPGSSGASGTSGAPGASGAAVSTESALGAESISGGSAAVQQAVISIERTGRRPLLLGSTQSRVSGYGATPRIAVSLQTQTDPQVLTGPPAGTWPFTYTIWMAAPTGF
jgi:hypothetical protein